MPPNQQTGVLFETDDYVETKNINNELKPRDYKLIWRNVIFYVYIHIVTVYATCAIFTSAKLLTTITAVVSLILGNIGIVAGAHRLFSHRSFKAKPPLKIILIFLETLAFQDSAFVWARNHRVHHKYTETDADPYNSRRGLYYSHVGWLLTKKHPDVTAKGNCVDVSDLLRDPIVRFQKDYYMPLMVFIALFLPTAIPMYFWGETFTNAWNLNMWRCCLGINMISCINSIAHRFGSKPYDKYIKPTEHKFVSIVTFGDGSHNYHHAFPWDYKTSEFGKFDFNLNGAFIELFAKIGWAYDLKTTSQNIVKNRVLRTGDGSHSIWGWNDTDMSKEEIENAVVLNSRDGNQS